MKRVTLSPFANELLYPIGELLSEVFLTAMSHLVESRPISLGFAQLEYMPSFGFAQYISSFGFVVIAENHMITQLTSTLIHSGSPCEASLFGKRGIGKSKQKLDRRL